MTCRTRRRESNTTLVSSRYLGTPIVVLSYEFDDEQVLNLSALQPLGKQFEPRMTHLARIAQTVPVMIYDARKTRADLRLPHFMELLPVRMPAYTCHHPKAYLVVTRSCVHLALGSMNLTRSGLFPIARCSTPSAGPTRKPTIERCWPNSWVSCERATRRSTPLRSLQPWRKSTGALAAGRIFPTPAAPR